MSSKINFNGANKAIQQGIINGMSGRFVPHIMPIIENRTPEDTGALIKSEKAEVIPGNNQTTLRISANTPYATKQHESTEFKHKKGEAGYILNPVSENLEEFMHSIASSISDSLNGGGR